MAVFGWRMYGRNELCHVLRLYDASSSRRGSDESLGDSHTLGSLVVLFFPYYIRINLWRRMLTEIVGVSHAPQRLLLY